MEITEVRIKLTSGKNEKLRAFCSITIDNDFVIRDLKVIEGAKGAFVAMPSRKLMARCPSCGGKNHYRAPYCNDCGGRLSPEKLSLDGRRKLHADLGPYDVISFPPGVARRFMNVTYREPGKEHLLMFVIGGNAVMSFAERGLL